MSKLDERLETVEGKVDKNTAATDRLAAGSTSLDGRVDDLESRVEALESSEPGTTTTP